MPNPHNTLKIISNINNTILINKILNTQQLLNNNLTIPTKNHNTIPKLTTLYHQITKKNPTPKTTPIFYISNSPHQLTNNLQQFLKINNFPHNILQLKKISTKHNNSLLNTPTYKQKHINKILTTFPKIKFILINNNKKKNPKIFTTITKKYPKHIKNI